MADVTIIYCRPCGYEKRAKDAAAALRQHLALEATLVPAKGGIFQVKVGDQHRRQPQQGPFSRYRRNRGRRHFRVALIRGGFRSLPEAATVAAAFRPT